MPMIKKSITVTEQQDDWINAQIETGHYGNESEVVRDLIRERQIRDQTRPVATRTAQDVSEPGPPAYASHVVASQGVQDNGARLNALDKLQASLQEKACDFDGWTRTVETQRQTAGQRLSSKPL